VLSATLLTENVAYPAFVWAVLLAYRAIVVPSVRRDAAAVGGLALAYLARTQLFVLALAVPFAVFAQERSLRSALARHRLLAAVYGAAAVAAAVLALIGALTTVFGNYESTIRGNPFPGRIWHSAAVHLDYVVVGTGVVPFILAGAWSLTAAAGAPPRARAFAFLFLILVPLLTLEAASFDVRFTPGGFVQDRYVSYLAPLFAVGAAACVLDRGRPGVRATTSLMVGLAFAVLASAAPYSGQTALYWASPAAAFHRVFGSAAQAVDISTVGFVQWASVAVAVLVAGALWLLPSWLTLSTLGVVLAALGALEAGYVFDRFAVPATTRSQAIEGVRRDWIDAAVPAGASVALVPNPDLSADYWWDAEFWNKSVDRALAVDGRQIFTPFAANEVSFAAETGRVLGAEPTNFLVLDMTESRFALRGTVPVAVARPLVLVRVARPYRAKWLISGAARDGWIRPGNGARIRTFGALRELAVTLRASADATGPQRFEIRSDGFVSRGQARPGDVATACLPRRRSIKLAVRDGARLHIDGLHTGRCD
jgi:hypothetical protein